MITENFTKSYIESLATPQNKRIYVQDSKVKGLALYVTKAGCRTFYVRKRIKGRDQKLTIGTYPSVSIENARKQALNYMGQIAFGKDPLAEERKERQHKLTLGEQCRHYMERHSKVEKRSWKFDERAIRVYFTPWLNRRLVDITREEIQLLIEKVRREKGKHEANSVLERIRHIYNKAIEWGWQGVNPAVGLKKIRVISRDRFILPNELPFFQRSLKEEANVDFRDFFDLLMLCGSRKTNTKMMRFDQIDFEWRIWRIPDTKNGEPLLVPLMDRALEILKRRKRLTNSPWVFPSPVDSNKHFTDPRFAWNRILIRATIYQWETEDRFASVVYGVLGKVNMYDDANRAYKLILKSAKEKSIELPTGLMDLRIHDIRRTFGSYQAISGASLQIIGSSLGHKSPQSTLIYARLNLDPIRDAMEKAASIIYGG